MPTPHQVRLSHRAAKVSMYSGWLNLTPDERSQFIDSVMSAAGFINLPTRWQMLITAAENELREQDRQLGIKPQ